MTHKTVPYCNDYEMLRVQLEIQEDLFRTLSLQIHDNVGQQLSLSKLYLKSLETGLKNETRKQVDVVRTLITGCIDDLRELAGIFSQETIRQSGLVDTLRKQVSVIRKTGHLQVELDIPERLADPGEANGIVLFRIIQQCMFDILSHALATKMTIRMWMKDNCLYVEIKDNRKEEKRVHASLIKKATLIHAEMHARYEPGSGMCVRIGLPLKPTADDKNSTGG